MLGLNKSPETPMDYFCLALRLSLGERCPYTKKHGVRVSTMAVSIGALLGLSKRDLSILKYAAACHDIGKLGLPDQLLYKPAPFNEAEWALMRTHSERGANLFRDSEVEDADEIAMVIEQHHEHFDGSGYPRGLVGETIDLRSRIISVVDSYDAMALPRVYQRARTHREIMNVLEHERGSKHDPAVLDVFFQVFLLKTEGEQQ
jgi:HD-GYP domain-containing protein (c-di-GMP phosphodiesterase class II)